MNSNCWELSEISSIACALLRELQRGLFAEQRQKEITRTGVFSQTVRVLAVLLRQLEGRSSIETFRLRYDAQSL